MKNVLWRACSGCLPTKHELIKRRVNVDPLFLVCSSVMETDFHVFISCPFSLSCWHLLDLQHLVNHGSSVFGWFSNLVHSVLLEKVLIAGMVLWGLWRNRNDFCWNNKRQSTVYLLYG